MNVEIAVAKETHESMNPMSLVTYDDEPERLCLNNPTKSSTMETVPRASDIHAVM